MKASPPSRRRGAARAPGAALPLLLCAALCSTARADERFTLVGADPEGGVIVATGQVPVVALPQRFAAHALLADSAAQDLLVLGVLDGGARAAGVVAGVDPRVTLLRYGRALGRGELRPISSLALPVPVGPGARLVATLTSTAPYPAVVLASGDGTLRFFDSRSGASQAQGALGESVDLSRAGVAEAVALRVIGSRLFVADRTAQIVRIDIPTATLARCMLDAPAFAIEADSDRAIAVTSAGRVAIPETCGGTLTSVGGAQSPSAELFLTARDRSFQVAERVVDILLPSSGNPAVGRRRVEIVLAPGVTTTTLAIDAGTCKATRFLVGGVYANGAAATEIRLFTGQERQALTIEQTAPGETCTANLLANNGASGAAPLRIRGAVEGAGATAILVDRSYSMELPLAGPPRDGGAPEGERRGDAQRQALSLLLATLAVLPDNVGAGRLAVLPFGDQVDGAPATGLATPVELANPDNPKGLRVRGFAGSTGDALTPSGGTDVAAALRAGVERVLTQAVSDAGSNERARRLWLWTDGLAAPDEAKLAPALRAAQDSGAGLRILGIGGAGLAPLPLLLRGSTDLSPRLGLAPRGYADVAASLSRVHENVLRAFVRDVLGGKSLPARVFGTLRKGQEGLAGQFALTGAEPWMLLLASWDHLDTTAQIGLTQGGMTLNPRCMRVQSAMICAAPAQQGIWRVTLTGGRDAGPETALLRVFAGGLGTVGGVGVQSSLGQALYRSGDDVRVSLRLTEQGLGLRGATVRAQVRAPQKALGTAAAQASLDRGDVTSLAQGNGDLARGQVRAELADPATLEEGTDLPEVVLNDDGKGADGEPNDGIYTGQFRASVPGLYRIDLAAEHRGVLTAPGTVVDELSALVVPALEAKTKGTVQLGRAGGGALQVRVTPQDSAGNLLGPGQASTLQVRDTTGTWLRSDVYDLLDGSYQFEVASVPDGRGLTLRGPGGEVTLADADAVRAALAGGGCAATGRGPLAPSGASALMAGALALWILRRVRSAATSRGR